ncbi:phage tail sheath family protein [Chitinophaga lutea]
MAALLDLRMPGVYTLEKSTLPPTVGVIPSAIPVFIGYTQKAEKKGESLHGKPTRVKSMKEYEDWFGGAPLQSLEVSVDDRNGVSGKPDVKVSRPTDYQYKMYHSLLFYYANGGGPCFIMSVGGYDAKISVDALKGALTPLKKSKDVTIIVYPDGTSLSNDDYKSLMEETLNHCVKMKNRVGVFDVHESFGEDLDEIENVFQTNVPSDIDVKKYGMAYYPYVETIFDYGYLETGVTVKQHLVTPPPASETTTIAAIKAKADALKAASDGYGEKAGEVADLSARQTVLAFLKGALDEYKAANPSADSAALVKKLYAVIKETGRMLPDDVKTDVDADGAEPITVLGDALDETNDDLTDANTELKSKKDALDAAATDARKGVPGDNNIRYTVPLTGVTMAGLKDANNLVYGKIKDAILNFPVTLPPCGAIAGIYVRTDANAGVWKAPANVSVFGGIKPALEIDDELHGSLNAPSSGKSINVIRTYPGRGLLVYGGRTFAGNDLEWRYVNVRRTFCFIEDSIQRAMQDFVFEPNNEQTWIKVRAMIKSFLNRLWKAGGLYGNTPEDAYEVVCDEPGSMTVDDVLNGIMRIFIKVAVARPAEFIVLEYEHKFEVAEG